MPVGVRPAKESSRYVSAISTVGTSVDDDPGTMKDLPNEPACSSRCSFWGGGFSPAAQALTTIDDEGSMVDARALRGGSAGMLDELCNRGVGVAGVVGVVGDALDLSRCCRHGGRNGSGDDAGGTSSSLLPYSFQTPAMASASESQPSLSRRESDGACGVLGERSSDGGARKISGGGAGPEGDRGERGLVGRGSPAGAGACGTATGDRGGEEPSGPEEVLCIDLIARSTICPRGRNLEA